MVGSDDGMPGFVDRGADRPHEGTVASARRTVTEAGGGAMLGSDRAPGNVDGTVDRMRTPQAVVLTVALAACEKEPEGEPSITDECSMDGNGSGSCMFTNLGTAAGTQCGKIHVTNKAGESAASGTFCSGDLAPKSTTTIEFQVGLGELCEWSDAERQPEHRECPVGPGRSECQAKIDAEAAARAKLGWSDKCTFAFEAAAT